MGQQWVRRLDHLEVDVSHIAESGARVIRVAAALRKQGTGDDMLAVLHIELADVAVEECDWVAWSSLRTSDTTTAAHPCGKPGIVQLVI